MNQGSGATVAGKMLIAILIVFFATGVSFPTDLRSGLFELPTTLKSLIDTAIAENESLKQLEAEFEAIKAEEPSAKALDDPRLTLGINALPVDTFSFNQEPMTQKQIIVSQRFPWFGKLDLRSQRMVLAASRKKEMIDAKKLELRRAVSEAYFDLHYTRREIELNGELTRMIGQILRVIETVYAGGKGLQQDIFQAQVELGRLLEAGENLKIQERNLENQLNILMNGKLFGAIEIPENLKMPPAIPSKEILVDLAMAQNPGIAALKTDIYLADVEIELAKKDYRPDVDVLLGYGQREDDLSGQSRADFVSGAVSFNIPVWFKSKQDNKLIAAQKRKSAAERALADFLSRIPLKVDTLVREMEGIHENQKLLDGVLILQTDQWARAALSAYEVGKVNFDTLINSQIRNLRLALQADRYRVSAFKVLSRLEEIVAIPLQEKNA